MRYHNIAIRMAKSRTLTIPNVDKYVEQWELYTFLLGIQNGTATLKDCLEVSIKLNILTKQSSNHALWYWPQGIETTCPYKNLHVVAYSSLIHNFQIWKQSGCPQLCEWINRDISNGIQSALKWAIKSLKDIEEPKYILLSKRSQSEKAQLYESIYMIFLKW